MNPLKPLAGFPVLKAISTLFSLRLYRVYGESMAPNYRPGQLLLAAPLDDDPPPRRGQAVLFTHPFVEGRTMLKRVVGLPGETVTLADGRIRVNGRPLPEPYLRGAASRDPMLDLQWRLAGDEYLLLGDNRSDSLDSVRLGPIKRRWITGTVRRRLPWG